LGMMNMRTLLKNCGVSLVTLSLGLALIATPAMARGVGGGGGSVRVGGGGGGFHGGGGRAGHGGYGGYGGGGGGYGYGNGYGYGGAALGLGLLGGAIIGSQYPYYGSGYDTYPQDGSEDSSASCASTYRSYDPATGTYLGYDGLRHPCP